MKGEIKKSEIFLDVDGVLIYQHDDLSISYNENLISALVAAGIKELNLLTSMRLRDVQERIELVEHLNSKGVKVKKVITSLDLKAENVVLGGVWDLAKGKTSYDKNKGELSFVKVTSNEWNKLDNINRKPSAESGEVEEGRTYRKTDKSILMDMILEDAEIGCALFIDDSCHQVASVRDSFKPNAEDVKENNELLLDPKALNDDKMILKMVGGRGILVTHYSRKEEERNTFQDYARSLLIFKTAQLSEKDQANWLAKFEDAIDHKKESKVVSEVTGLFKKLNKALEESVAKEEISSSASTSATASTSTKKSFFSRFTGKGRD